MWYVRRWRQERTAAPNHVSSCAGVASSAAAGLSPLPSSTEAETRVAPGGAQAGAIWLGKQRLLTGPRRSPSSMRTGPDTGAASAAKYRQVTDREPGSVKRPV